MLTLILAWAGSSPAETTSYSDFYVSGKSDGSVPIPPNLDFNIEFPHSPVKTPVTSHRITDADAHLAALIKRLRFLSLSDFPDQEREVGAVVVNYANGTSKTVIFTSNRITDIDNEFETKMLKSKKLHQAKLVKSIVHLHTHPERSNFLRRTGTTGSGVMFSEMDVSLYQSLKMKLQKITGREIPLTGIVVPSCSFCGDLFFATKL